MLRWFKARERGEAGASEVADGARASNDARRASKGKFLLEPLEPRVLLSADSIFGEVYRTLLEDEGQNTGAEFAVIVEEIDAATSAEIAAADGADCGIAATDSGPTVDWPEGWQVGALQDPTENPIRDLTHESEAAETTVATEDEEQPEASVLEQAGAASADPELQPSFRRGRFPGRRRERRRPVERHCDRLRAAARTSGREPDLVRPPFGGFLG